MRVDTATQSAPAQALLQRLRTATAEAHERLHVHPLTEPLTSPNLTHAHYILILHAFYGFYAPLASCTESAAMRAMWLEEDLDYFDQKPPNIPRCFDRPPLKEATKQMGFLYVTEGSSLGSQVISKHLQKSLGLTQETGGRFFHAHGKETGTVWRHTKTLLEAQPIRSYDAIICAAQHAFLSLERWLTHCHERHA